MISRLLAVAMFIALLVPAEAIAAPPVLLTVGVQSGRATATWSLPPGVQAEVLEVATSPVIGPDGYYFLAENRKVFDGLEDTQTSWTDTYSIDPGTYYVHVVGFDEACFYANLCPVREASNVMELTISAPKPTPKPTPTPKPKPKPKPKPRPPGTLAAARLTGYFDVTERYTSASGLDLKVGSKDTDSWRFVPQCSKGGCTVRMSFEYTHALTPFESGHTQKITLTRRGASYSGSARMKALTCMSDPVAGTMSVKINVTKGGWVNGIWRATRFAGNARVEAPAATSGVFRCPTARYAASLRGSLDTEV